MNARSLLPTCRARDRFALDALAREAPPGAPPVAEPGPRWGRVLDVGCGEALLHGRLAPLCGVLDGCDAHPGDIAAAARRAAADPRRRYHCADAHALPWPDGTFDAALCMDLVEHLADPDRALRELARVLRPGGLLVLTAPSARFPLLYDPLHALAGRRLLPIGAYAYGHVSLPDPDALARALEGAGLRVTRAARLAGPLAAAPEAYWAGLVQRFAKGNASNTGRAVRPGVRLGEADPPGVRWVDRLLDLDARLPGGRGVGIGLLARA